MIISTSPNIINTNAASSNFRHTRKRDREGSLMEISAPPISVLHVVVFKDSRDPFLSLLKEHGIAHEEMMLKANVVMAGGFIVDILQSSAPWVASLAAVICAFLKNKRSRKVIITKNDNTVIHCEGLNKSEIESVLSQAKSLTAIETSKYET
jgi:hypothetical protein